jgi:type I restriction enzyme R subunit
MSLSEADTRAKLIDPALHNRGWTEDLIRQETTPAVEVIHTAFSAEFALREAHR